MPSPSLKSWCQDITQSVLNGFLWKKLQNVQKIQGYKINTTTREKPADRLVLSPSPEMMAMTTTTTQTSTTLVTLQTPLTQVIFSVLISRGHFGTWKKPRATNPFWLGSCNYSNSFLFSQRLPIVGLHYNRLGGSQKNDACWSTNEPRKSC